jgi:hypothetical protein
MSALSPTHTQRSLPGNYPGNKSYGCPIAPDFLWRFVALIHSMRLSLMKGAHADLSSTAWQEIGVKPYFGLSGLGCPPTPDLPRYSAVLARTGFSTRLSFLVWRQFTRGRKSAVSMRSR